MNTRHFFLNYFNVLLLCFTVLADKNVPDYIMNKLKGNPDVAKLIDSYGIEERGRNFETEAIALQNEPCKPRLSVVPIAQPGGLTSFYYPYYVQVHRCHGGCGPLQFISKCRAKETKTILTKVVSITWSSGRPEDEIPPTLAYVQIQNHTSCECNCKKDGNICNRYQYWDTNNCKCSCLGWGCPGNFVPHPNSCCSCEIKDKKCEGRKKVWNADHCACLCKNLERPCKVQGKIRSPATCKCVCPPIVCKSGTKLNIKTCGCEPYISNML